MSRKELDEEWKVLAKLLPPDWEGLARTTHALRRAREVKTPEVLLRLLLLHVGTGLSLQQAVARAKTQRLASMSAVALHKRLRASGDWLHELARRLFEQSRFTRLPRLKLAGFRLRAVDATTVEEPGATGTAWRVHYSFALPQLCCDFYELTDAHGGETLDRIPVRPGDLLLGDRAYGHREALARVVEAQADAVVRLTISNFPLQSRGGKPFGILRHLRTLKGCRPKSWPVSFVANEKTYQARLCAIRKTNEAARKARIALRKQARKKGKKLQPRTLKAAGYIFVLTTVSSRRLSARQVLELYRARWQIELAFKRMKSLMQAGHVPKSTDQAARAWIEGKMLTALLVERLLEEARLFSPWGHDGAAPESLA